MALGLWVRVAVRRESQASELSPSSNSYVGPRSLSPISNSYVGPRSLTCYGPYPKAAYLPELSRAPDLGHPPPTHTLRPQHPSRWGKRVGDLISRAQGRLLLVLGRLLAKVGHRDREGMPPPKRVGRDHVPGTPDNRASPEIRGQAISQEGWDGRPGHPEARRWGDGVWAPPGHSQPAQSRPCFLSFCIQLTQWSL